MSGQLEKNRKRTRGIESCQYYCKQSPCRSSRFQRPFFRFRVNNRGSRNMQTQLWHRQRQRWGTLMCVVCDHNIRCMHHTTTMMTRSMNSYQRYLIRVIVLLSYRVVVPYLSTISIINDISFGIVQPQGDAKATATAATAPTQLPWVESFLQMFGERSTAFADALFKNSEEKGV